MRNDPNQPRRGAARRAAGLLLLGALCVLLALASSCGRKGRLLPRDRLETDDERLPPKWGQPTPDPFGAQIGVDGLIEKAGDPARVRGVDLSPEPLPPLTPPPAPPAPPAAEPPPAPETTPAPESP